ncbi:MAG: hypothetical protein ACE145_07360 [Terriglobia bacterium]
MGGPRILVKGMGTAHRQSVAIASMLREEVFTVSTLSFPIVSGEPIR